ncbi:MAG: hypothetical protein MPK09_07435, partial [Gammaproteobacteria bacterium]|nr:hypothetical protein [Gammaproteobacteria bacterium]
MSNMSNTSKRNSAFRGGKFSVAIFSFLAIFLFAAFPGAASAQGLKLRLDPADGVVNLKDATRCADLTHYRNNLGAGCPVVRVTPYFENAAARPSERTVVKILPRTPTIRTTAVVVSGANTFEATQAAKDRVAAAATAQTNAFTAFNGARGPTRHAAFRTYLAAVKEHRAAVTALLKSKQDAERLDPSTKVVTTNGVNPDYRPEGYVPVRGDQYAALGEDYYLTSGEIVLNPDGTIEPSHFQVRGLKRNVPRDKTALFGLYVSTGDKKYGAVAAEFGVLFKAPPDNQPTVELYFVPDNSVEVRENTRTGYRGTILTRVVAGVVQPVRLKARLMNPYGGQSITADADIRLKLGALPRGLSVGDFSAVTSTYQQRVYQPMPQTLTIRAGESSAITSEFLVLPETGVVSSHAPPAPVIVDAAGDPVDTEMRTTVHSVTISGSTGGVDLSGRDRRAGEATVFDNQEAVEPPTDSQRIGSALGSVVRGVTLGTRVRMGYSSDPSNIGGCRGTGNCNIAALLEIRVRPDDSTGANSVDATDFVRRNLDGSFSQLTAAGFASGYSYHTVVVEPGPPTNAEYRAPVYLRHDGLVEGPETFKFRLHRSEKVVTIPANGAATLKVGYTAADGGGV